MNIYKHPISLKSFSRIHQTRYHLQLHQLLLCTKYLLQILPTLNSHMLPQTISHSWTHDSFKELILEELLIVENRGATSSIQHTIQFRLSLLWQTPTALQRTLWRYFSKRAPQWQASITHSRSHNIGDYITQAKLHEATGSTTSITMGKYGQGLDQLIATSCNKLLCLGTERIFSLYIFVHLFV